MFRHVYATKRNATMVVLLTELIKAEELTEVLTETEIQESLAELRGTNAAQLKLLKKQGCPLELERAIDHHFCAFSEIDANLLAEALEDSGDYIEVSVSAAEAEDSDDEEEGDEDDDAEEKGEEYNGDQGEEFDDDEDEEYDECWSVEAKVLRAPKEAASEQVTEDLVRLAAKFNAAYDGWGTEID